MLASITPLWLLFSVVNGCGEQRSKTGKIIGGREVDAQQYPWYVALVRSGSGSSNLVVECGATLISKTHLLTAAHCFGKIPAPMMALVYKAVFVLEDRCAGRYSLVKGMSKVNVHPNFSFNTLKNDIAVAKLASAVNFEPACLPPSNSRTGGQGTIIGYGNLLTSGRKFPCNLQEATVNVYSWNTCLRTGNYRDIAMLPKTFCAGQISGGVDTCNGDSGGPLLQTNTAGNYYIKGITSFGHGCAQRNNPGVYTDVSKYISWVQRTVGTTRKTQTKKSVSVG